MKPFLKFLGIICTIVMVVWDVAEFLAVPAFAVVIGILNSFPWQYYAVAIGGYLAVFVAIELIAHFVFKALDKKYTPIIVRKREKYLNTLPVKK